jgi:hypothetical protein
MDDLPYLDMFSPQDPCIAVKFRFWVHVVIEEHLVHGFPVSDTFHPFPGVVVYERLVRGFVLVARIRDKWLDILKGVLSVLPCRSHNGKVEGLDLVKIVLAFVQHLHPFHDLRGAYR